MLLFSPLARADEMNQTIYIRADGSVDPVSAPIRRDGETYFLTSNITFTLVYCWVGIIIERSNITLDGGGFTLMGIGRSPRRDIPGPLKPSLAAGIIALESDLPYGFAIAISNNTSSVTIKNLRIIEFDGGIYLQGSNNRVCANDVTNITYSGISMIDSTKNTIFDNNIVNNGGAVWISDSSYNQIIGNNITNSRRAISVSSSSYNLVVGNNITSNEHGITLAFSVNNNYIFENGIANNLLGIFLLGSYNNRISRNNITNNLQGIQMISCTNNSICENEIVGNKEEGIFLDESSNNKIYWNNFIANSKHVYDDAAYTHFSKSINVWDDGYPNRGNYWSDYSGADLNGDGIGDSPYSVDQNNLDHYPLFTPYIIPEYPSFVIILLFVLVTLAVTILRKGELVLIRARR